MASPTKLARDNTMEATAKVCYICTDLKVSLS